MKKLFSTILGVVSLGYVSCSPVTNPVYKEVAQHTEANSAVINGYKSGGDYLVISKLDGKDLPMSEQYFVKPGRRHLVMNAIYKGLVIEEMQYHVKVEEGKSYTLKPSLSEISESWAPTKSEFRTRSFMPLFIDDQSGAQIYPPVPKSLKNN